MKKTLAILSVILVGVFFTAGVAMGMPTNENRIFDEFASSDLQDLFNERMDTDIGIIDAINDQSSAGTWLESEATVDAYLVTMLESMGGTLGIFSEKTGEEFDFVLGDSKSASFNIDNAGDLWIDKTEVSLGFGDEFGFYWYDALTQNKSYTKDTMNQAGYGPDENIMALTYIVPHGYTVDTESFGADGDSVTAMNNNDWILAFENDPSQAQGADFTDAVFYIEDIEDAPEPATLLLFGAGLLGLGTFGRRKKGSSK